MLGLEADCVSYTATADLRPHEAVDDLCRILESGKNVVSSSIVPLVHPPSADRAFADVDRLEAACKAGSVSCFTSGIDPGFANDVLPLLLTGVCERIDEVRVQEILNYSTYDQPEVLFGTMGFGRPLDDTPLPGLRRYWRGPTWINAAWLIWIGLVRLGYTEHSSELRRRIAELVGRARQPGDPQSLVRAPIVAHRSPSFLACLRGGQRAPPRPELGINGLRRCSRAFPAVD